MLWVLICTMHLTVRTYYVTYAFQSESTLYSGLIVKKILAQNRRHIWSLSDCNGTQTHNHLVHKRTLNHLAKLAFYYKWLICVAITCLYCALTVRTYLNGWVFLYNLSVCGFKSCCNPTSDMAPFWAKSSLTFRQL